MQLVFHFLWKSFEEFPLGEDLSKSFNEDAWASFSFNMGQTKKSDFIIIFPNALAIDSCMYNVG